MTEEQATALDKGKKVLVIDDGPTLTHGGMAYGVGFVMAKHLEAAEIVDPRPYVKGSLVGVFEKFIEIKNMLPAMGYGDKQVKDMQATIKATPCDTLVIGTVVARYELEVLPKHSKQFHDMLDSFTRKLPRQRRSEQQQQQQQP